MTKDELVTSLNFLYDGEHEVEINIYTLNNEGNVCLFNINDDLKDDLKADFLNSVRQKMIVKEYDLQDYSSADRRNNSYYFYDLEEKPEGFDFFDKVLEPDIEYYNIDENWIGGISKMLVVLSTGEHWAILYKDVSGVEKYYAQSGFLMFKSDNRFDRVEDDILRISNNFQMIEIDDKIIILKMEAMEMNYDLDQVLKNEAERGKTRIEGLLTDIDKISELCDKDNAFCKQLIATKQSFVFTLKNEDGSRMVSDNDIIKYIRDNEELCGKFSFSEDNKIKISHFTQAKRFVKILNEDYLKSGLTKIIYDTLSKKKRNDNIIIDEE